MKRCELEEKIIKKVQEDSNYKKKLLANPKAVIEKELGKALPAGFEFKVVEETPSTAYIRIPANPNELSDDDLDNVAGGLLCFSSFSIF